MLRSIRPIFITIALSVIVTLLLIEIVLYLKPDMIPAQIRTAYFMAGAENYPPGTIPDDQVGYKFAPNLSDLSVSHGDRDYTISTSSLGYKGTGFRDDGLDGEPFAVVVGDSITACVGVEQAECWVELLEGQTGRDFANLGVSGYGPDLQLRMLQQYGLPLRPKLVIWVFFANDLIQGWRFKQFGQGGVAGGEFWQNPVRGWLAKHSSIYLTLSYFWYERHFFRHLYSDDPAVAGKATLAWWLAYSDPAVPEVAEGLERTKQLILQADQQAKAELEDAELVVLIIPFREQLLDSTVPFHSTFNAAGHDLAMFCRQNDIPIIDLTPLVKAQKSHETAELYLEDSHLTPQGNEVVAEILAKELTPMMPEE